MIAEEIKKRVSVSVPHKQRQKLKEGEKERRRERNNIQEITKSKMKISIFGWRKIPEM
jgi:hypothetical protein